MPRNMEFIPALAIFATMASLREMVTQSAWITMVSPL